MASLATRRHVTKSTVTSNLLFYSPCLSYECIVIKGSVFSTELYNGIEFEFTVIDENKKEIPEK